MKRCSQSFLYLAFVVVLLTTACGTDQQGIATPAGTILPGSLDLTSTAAFAPDTTMIAETQTAATASTGLETPTESGTQGVASTQAATVVGSPTAGSSLTPAVPVTGVDIVLVECQFCVDTMAHALLVLPDTATFEIVSSTTTTTTTVDTNCSTIEVNNGKQVVLCSGPELTPLTLNICTNGNACTNFPVQLLSCPLSQAAVPNATNKTQPAPNDSTAVPTTYP